MQLHLCRDDDQTKLSHNHQVAHVPNMNGTQATTHSAASPARRFVHTPRQADAPSTSSTIASSSRLAPAQVPAEILHDEQLNAAIAAYLPRNYSFEIHKTIHHVRHYRSTCVALQMPEGLTLWATAISDIVERFTDATSVIMGDVTYGACCVDDFTARALGADLLVHYGHSCLVPVDQTSIRTLYVFVEIAVDPSHICATIRSNFPPQHDEFAKQIIGDSTRDHGRAKVDVQLEGDGAATAQHRRPTHMALVATVQFINALQGLKERLERTETHEDFYDAGGGARGDAGQRLLGAASDVDAGATMKTRSWHASPYQVTIPQAKPLSPGEVLGCTSPKLPPGVDAIIYIGDGRFHLESIMIANPRLPAFRYDPYEKRFVHEGYDHALMRSNRSDAVETAKQSLQAALPPTSVVPAGTMSEDEQRRRGWGLVLGTLGRQGSTRVLAHLRSMLVPTGMRTVPILLSELSPQKLALFGDSLLTFVQTSCPRLSIDWGDAFAVPLLSPYEAAVALGKTAGWQMKPTSAPAATALSSTLDTANGETEGDYPMDFYSDNSRGPWTPRHGMGARKGNAKGISNRELLKRGSGARKGVST